MDSTTTQTSYTLDSYLILSTLTTSWDDTATHAYDTVMLTQTQ